MPSDFDPHEKLVAQRQSRNVAFHGPPLRSAVLLHLLFHQFEPEVVFEQVGDAHLFHGSTAVAVPDRQLALFANVLLERFFSVAVRHGVEDETMALLRYGTSLELIVMTAIHGAPAMGNSFSPKSSSEKERSECEKRS